MKLSQAHHNLIIGLSVQIMLFDETRKLLDSRFLRRDEVIRSGESVSFDGHLVEIGECEDIHEPLANLKVQRSSCNIAEKSEEMQRQQKCIKINNSDGEGHHEYSDFWNHCLMVIVDLLLFLPFQSDA